MKEEIRINPRWALNSRGPESLHHMTRSLVLANVFPRARGRKVGGELVGGSGEVSECPGHVACSTYSKEGREVCRVGANQMSIEAALSWSPLLCSCEPSYQVVCEA